MYRKLCVLLVVFGVIQVSGAIAGEFNRWGKKISVLASPPLIGFGVIVCTITNVSNEAREVEREILDRHGDLVGGGTQTLEPNESGFNAILAGPGDTFEQYTCVVSVQGRPYQFRGAFLSLEGTLEEPGPAGVAVPLR